MALVVQKYGGTSVGTTEKIKHVASRVKRTRDAGNVVVSTGEQVTIGLLSMALKTMGQDAISLMGFQVSIQTDNVYAKARISRIGNDRIFGNLKEGKVVVVPGFQGIDEIGNVTTLGRGGSEIYTDVEGIYTTDPNIVPDARKIPRISYDEMLEMASLGAKVLQIRSVEFAKKYNVPLHVRSTFTETEGTWVTKEDEDMENVDMIIQNISTDEHTDLTFTVPIADLKNALNIVGPIGKEIGANDIVTDDHVAKVSIVGSGMRSHSGIASKMFTALAGEGINIMMISTSEIKVSCVIESKYTELAVRVLHEAFELGEEAV